MTLKEVLIYVNFVGAFFGLIGAWYWFKSAKTNLPAIDPTTGRPKGPVDMLSLNRTLVEGASANKVAAGWTAASTIVLGLSSLLASLTAAP